MLDIDASLLRESPVLLLHLPEETRTHVAAAGVRAWRHGLWSLLYGAGVALALYWLSPKLGLQFEPTIAIAAGLVVLLAGLSLVGSVGDVITGAPVTAAGRFFELVMMTAATIAGADIGDDKLVMEANRDWWGWEGRKPGVPDGTATAVNAHERAAEGEDARGTGRTESEATPFSRIDDVLAVFDAHGIEHAVLIGNSLGGQTAIDTAISAPDRVAGLVGIAAVYAPANPPPVPATMTSVSSSQVVKAGLSSDG
mgnify:CR=1 FL=1